MPIDLPKSLILVGAGKMGGAMLAGWLKSGLPGPAIHVIDPHPSPALRELCDGSGIALNEALPDEPEVLVLGMKPQMLESALPVLAPLAGGGTLVLSILAGKTIGDIAARLPRAGAIVRAMPNLPASIGRGISAAVSGPALDTRQHALATALLGAVGQVEWLDHEELIDAVTAVSGSGPAYVFLLAECLAQAGEQAGLSPDLAERLARATVEGAGELLFQSDQSPAALRQAVTSPGGTTAAALAVLMDANGMQSLLTAAVAAAKRRASALSG